MTPDFSDVTLSSENVPEGQERRTYTVQKGDNLSKISKEMYGNANDWKKIFEANKDKIHDPDKIQPGWELIIP